MQAMQRQKNAGENNVQRMVAEEGRDRFQGRGTELRETTATPVTFQNDIRAAVPSRSSC